MNSIFESNIESPAITCQKLKCSKIETSGSNKILSNAMLKIAELQNLLLNSRT